MTREPHPAVQHAVHLRIKRHREGMSRVGLANDWLATHLAVVFGVAWTVWAFMTIPLLVLLAPAGVKAVVFFLSSGWIQLFALPLLVYVGNKVQRSSDAQSEVMHQAQTHIAHAVDVAVDRLDSTTTGGITEVLAAQAATRAQIGALADLVRAQGGGHDA
jgi:hypothetical protein